MINYLSVLACTYLPVQLASESWAMRQRLSRVSTDVTSANFYFWCSSECNPRVKWQKHFINVLVKAAKQCIMLWPKRTLYIKQQSAYRLDNFNVRQHHHSKTISIHLLLLISSTHCHSFYFHLLDSSLKRDKAIVHYFVSAFVCI